MRKKITVIVVDDSAYIRQMFSAFLSEDPDIEVVATAFDPYDAREKIKEFNPDVITLDVEMPKMDGLSFLEKIIRLRPMPVVMISTLTQKGADTSIRALEIGAVDVIGKPADQSQLSSIKNELIHKVKVAAKAVVNGKSVPQAGLESLSYKGNPDRHLICIGASTGGVEAIRDVLTMMPANSPPILIVQHIPAQFSASFARRLDSLCQINVVEAAHNMPIASGTAYIAPGSLHLTLRKALKGFQCHLQDSELVSGHKPSVDVLFHSVAEIAAPQTVAAILTGMGKDGALGLLKLKEAGAHTIAQSEASCVVYGMPKAAFTIGACMEECSLPQIAGKLLAHCVERKHG